MRPDRPRRSQPHGGSPTQSDLIGRDAELARLRHMVDSASVSASVLVLLGEPGVGKSALLASVVSHAERTRMKVLRVAGSESEANLAFAALHQLLRPVLHRAAGLAPRQRQALLGAFGLTDESAAVDQLLISIASLTLLSDVSERSSLLVVIDDAHWVDASSLDVLAFVARRLDRERLVLIVSARGESPPRGFDSWFNQLRLDPLSIGDAHRLLDRLPHSPRGAARIQVLAHASGNPLALIELGRVIAAEPDAGRGWSAAPLPVTDRLRAAFAGQLVQVPRPTREALLLAAAADSSEIATVVAQTDDVWLPAERMALVRLSGHGVTFSHPLVRSAAYHTATFAERAAAHRRLAALLQDKPDRRAWHLATAAIQPDESVAALLAATAADAQRRGGAAAAALALQRAAELSPDREDRARRLTAAAHVAISTGQAAWVEDLAARAIDLTMDAQVARDARRASGWALTWTNRHAAALTVLTSVAEEECADSPEGAWTALTRAATVAYQMGDPAARHRVARIACELDRTAEPHVDGPAKTAELCRVWVRAAIDPFGAQAEKVAELHRIVDAGVDHLLLSAVGAAAWVLDESDTAVELLQQAAAHLQAPGLRGASGAALSALMWAYLDSGRWDDALVASAESAGLAEAYQMEIVAAASLALDATVHALRGNADAARQHAAEALSCVNPNVSRSIVARVRRATGLAAEVDGNYKMAYAQQHLLFAEDGTPLHYHASYLAIADLAAAAVRAERALEGHALVERALEHLDGSPSPRLAQLIGRARALLAQQDDAERHFQAALSDRAGERWPFERAQLRLDYAEWLRRRRRISEARPLVYAALEVFRWLDAKHWIDRASRELRASGVSVAAAPHPLLDLTPQQRQIVVLAAQGLTNREIAERLYLSPRTVSSHLYRSFPRLGITTRSQLRDVVGGSVSPVLGPDASRDPDESSFRGR